jgi:CheY-like chemotaxis protein
LRVNVLIVEDSPTLRWIYIQQFAKLGITVDCASNGVEALERIQRNWYRLILMDVDMPILDGIETTRKLRVLESKGVCKRAVITAVTATADRQKCLDAGMDYYMEKPLSLDDLRCLLQEARITGPAQTKAAEAPADAAAC